MRQNAAETVPADNELSKEQQVLLAELYVPAFVQKCAELGHKITDEASLQESLEGAALVKYALASKSQSLVKQANASLKALLGLDKAEERAAVEKRHEKTASALGENPNVRAAVMSLLQKAG
jgi:hypothetical protein